MLRLPVLTLLLTLVAAPAAPAQNAVPAARLQSQLQSLIAGFHGQVSVYAEDLATGRTVAIRADEPVPTASVIKLGILYTALEQMRAGKLRFTDLLTLRAQDKVPGSGVLDFFDTPLTITVKDALTLMIAESDNTATNMLIDRIGLKTIDDQLVAMGLKQTWLYKKAFQRPVPPFSPAEALYGMGKTTAREMAGVMRRFVACNLGPAPAPLPGARAPGDAELCRAAMTMLREQTDRNGIPRYLDPSLAIANKTGALDRVRNDVGAVFTPRGVIILSIFTHDNRNTSWTADNPALILIARVAKTVVGAWAPGSAGR